MTKLSTAYTGLNLEPLMEFWNLCILKECYVTADQEKNPDFLKSSKEYDLKQIPKHISPSFLDPLNRGQVEREKVNHQRRSSPRFRTS